MDRDDHMGAFYLERNLREKELRDFNGVSAGSP